jgi:uncharacterized protein (TIGR03435 family)
VPAYKVSQSQWSRATGTSWNIGEGTEGESRRFSPRPVDRRENGWRRIVARCRARVQHKMGTWRKGVFVNTTACVIVICAAGANLGMSQTLRSVHFEVASIKPVTMDVPMRFSGGPGSADPERVTYSRIPVVNLIEDAFSVRREQIAGPSWLDSEVFAVTAKMPPGTSLADFRLMMGNLLADRFGLRFHRETMTADGFELTVDRSGPKMIRPLPDSAPDVRPIDGRPVPTVDGKGFPVLRPGLPWAARTDGGVMRMTGRGTMGFLADRLSAVHAFSAGIPGTQLVRVIDKTGLVGAFEFRLEFALPAVHGEPSPGGAAEPERDVDVFVAVRQQLGLKLNASQVKTESLVIDHLERVPTEN